MDKPGCSASKRGVGVAIVAILRGVWMGHGPPRFLVGCLFGAPSLFLISRLSSLG